MNSKQINIFYKRFDKKFHILGTDLIYEIFEITKKQIESKYTYNSVIEDIKNKKINKNQNTLYYNKKIKKINIRTNNIWNNKYLKWKRMMYKKNLIYSYSIFSNGIECECLNNI